MSIDVMVVEVIPNDQMDGKARETIGIRAFFKLEFAVTVFHNLAVRSDIFISSVSKKFLELLSRQQVGCHFQVSIDDDQLSAIMIFNYQQ
jgi:hypothetical protein